MNVSKEEVTKLYSAYGVSGTKQINNKLNTGCLNKRLNSNITVTNKTTLGSKPECEKRV